MSFTELHGRMRAVHAIRTADHGRKWEYVRNLNDEFDYDFNESSLQSYADGFIIICRGYDQTTKVFYTDRDFKLLQQRDLSSEYECIDYIGRPELLKKDGCFYILCRNIERGASTGTLQLYRLD